MLAVLYFFIDLALLRRAPQDLPASSVLFGIVLAVGLVGGVLLAVTAGSPPLLALLQGFLDLALMLAALYLALNLTKHPGRFLQTATALVGAETLVGVLALVPVGLAATASEESAEILLAGLLFLALVAWSVLITAHILRHAFAISLPIGAAIAIGFDLFSFVVVAGLTEAPT